jgi:hypothetical protein
MFRAAEQCLFHAQTLPQQRQFLFRARRAQIGRGELRLRRAQVYINLPMRLPLLQQLFGQ